MIKTLEVAGIGPSFHAMRNPYDSWKESDTHHGKIGPIDAALSNKLAMAGTEHCKHMRMIIVWAEMWMPLYWWKQFDTYRMGVEKESCSTMHTIAKRNLTEDDFAYSDEEDKLHFLIDVLPRINNQIDIYNNNRDDKEARMTAWKKIISDMPESFIQRRTVMMSYAALRSMYFQRKGHKLKEWMELRNWVTTLPESWIITSENIPMEEEEDL